MAFISKFCFSCSVKLGSVITAILTLVQGCVLLGMVLSYTNSLSTVTETLNDWINILHLDGSFYREVAKNPKLVIILASTFFSSLICSSVLLIYGCFQTKTLWMYPFVFFYLFYILCLFLGLLLLIFWLKFKGNGLGDLILFSNLGGFILLFYLYTWACVVSLIQIINELKERLKQKLRVVENMKLSTKLKAHNKKTKSYNYAHFN